MNIIAALALAFLFQSAPPANTPANTETPAAKQASNNRLMRLLGTSLEKADGKKVPTADVIKGTKECGALLHSRLVSAVQKVHPATGQVLQPK